MSRKANPHFVGRRVRFQIASDGPQTLDELLGQCLAAVKSEVETTGEVLPRAIGLAPDGTGMMFEPTGDNSNEAKGAFQNTVLTQCRKGGLTLRAWVAGAWIAPPSADDSVRANKSSERREAIFVGVTEGATARGAIMEIVRDWETGKASAMPPVYLDDDGVKSLLPLMQPD